MDQCRGPASAALAGDRCKKVFSVFLGMRRILRVGIERVCAKLEFKRVGEAVAVRVRIIWISMAYKYLKRI